MIDVPPPRNSSVPPEPALPDAIAVALAWVRRSRFLGVSTLATAAANALFQVTILLLIVQAHQDGDLHSR